MPDQCVGDRTALGAPDWHANIPHVTALTPPDRPAHAFTFTPVNLTSSYTPPAVAGAGGTGYAFNLDRQPTTITRPDGQTTFGYDAGARLRTVTFSRGILGYRFGARDYDPQVGRWTAKDPIGLEAGANIYEYVGSSPVDRVDTSGLDWFRSDRKSTRLNSSHLARSRMPSSA